MIHIMIGISGYSGVGKDEFARGLINSHNAIHTGLADPAKRHMADVYGFSENQLFGPSSERNFGDLRYPKKSFFEYDLKLHESELPREYAELYQNSEKRYFLCNGYELDFVPEGHPSFWLSPREALQKYMGLMNDLFENTWVRMGIEVHKKLALTRNTREEPCREYWPMYTYDRMRGLQETVHFSADNNPYWKPYDGFIVTCFSDFRHKHEIKSLRESKGHNTIPISIRIKRPTVPSPPYDHRSEIEQSTIPDKDFDFVIDNDKTIGHLWNLAADVVTEIKHHSK